MYDPANGHRAPERSRHPKTESEPGHSHFVTRPYTAQRPAPAHQTEDERTAGATGDIPHPPHSSSRNRSPSLERVGSPFVPQVLAHYHYPTSSNAIDLKKGTAPVTPGSRTPSPAPERAGHQGSASISVKATQGSAPPIRGAAQPSAPHPAGGGQSRGQGRRWLGALTRSRSPPPRREGMRQVYHSPPPSPRHRDESTSATYRDPPRHRSSSHYHHYYRRPHHYSSTPHRDHHRSRSRPPPPSAPSHRYASTFTHPVYGSSATSSTSYTSLNDGIPLHRHPHHASPQPHPTAPTYLQGPGLGRTHSATSQRSHGPPRPLSPSLPPSIALPRAAHKLEKPPPSPPLAANEVHRPTHAPRPLAASELCRNPHRPALPPNFDGQMETRYVNMLLAMDGISPLYYVLSSFFTWILLAGFVLFPGTFASFKDRPSGSAVNEILNLINHFGLYIIAFLCTGIGAAGMICLWFRWHGNYIWVSNRIFIPGFLNSMAGVISTLASIYGTQEGVFGKTEKSALFVTASLSVICGTLVLVYEFWLIRNLRLEHDHEVGVELAGKWGEGVLGEKREGSEEV